jgi:hypothetical protein
MEPIIEDPFRTVSDSGMVSVSAPGRAASGAG